MHSADIKIVKADNKNIWYTTRLDSFYYVRRAKIKQNHNGLYFVCLFGKRKDLKSTRFVYIINTKKEY